jgi:chromosome segregation ATPase
MGIENIMYFALGALAAGLIALMIMPAIWRRAVRLTRKRIEAATPMSMAEFRADKDRLRAEFALSTRRLEMNVEALRKRLADQVGDISRKRNDLSALKTDRDQHLASVAELEERETDLRARILELEHDGIELSQRLASRDRDYAAKTTAFDTVRNAIRAHLPEGTALSGDYDDDIDELLSVLALERKRAAFLEEQASSLVSRLEGSDRRSTDTNAAIAELRRALAIKDDRSDDAAHELVVAEARIASAENRLNALLEETKQLADGDGHLVTEKLSVDEQVARLKSGVLSVEASILADFGTDDFDAEILRQRLGAIAADVSRIVYAADSQPVEAEESLFDRVQKFANDGLAVEEFSVKTKPRPVKTKGKVTDRMAALRDLQGRG